MITKIFIYRNLQYHFWVIIHYKWCKAANILYFKTNTYNYYKKKNKIYYSLFYFYL